MAQNFWEIPVDKDTPREMLERMIASAEHTSDWNIVKKLGEAKAEIVRRDREYEKQLKIDELNGLSQIHEKQAKSLRRIVEQQISATNESTSAHLRVATMSANAAKWAAIAAIVIAILTATGLAIDLIGDSGPDNQSLIDAIDRQTDAILRKTTD